MIVFQNVSYTYPKADRPVLDNLSLHVPLREIRFLVGESGAGKTTAMKLILKELEPSSGEIRVNGRRLSTVTRKEIPQYRRRIGFVSQEIGLLPDKTVYENVELAKLAVGANANDIRIQVAMALKVTGMEAMFKKYPQELSGGQQKKVCIARALVNHPDLILADEPTGNLDPEGSVEIMELFKELNRQGIAFLIATHDTGLLHNYDYPTIVLNRQGV